MRLSTALAAFCCTKRVSSPRSMLKLCQWMMAPGLLVTVSCEPCAWKLAWPPMTCGLSGLAPAPMAAMAATHTTARRSLGGGECLVGTWLRCMVVSTVAPDGSWGPILERQSHFRWGPRK
jgi:hypothetical protein